MACSTQSRSNHLKLALDEGIETGHRPVRVTDKLTLIDKIGRELQDRYTFAELDAFLEACDISPDRNLGRGSKWVYTKEVLRTASNEVVTKVAEELDLVAPGSRGRVLLPPITWRDEKAFRLFISHVSKEKAKAFRLKDCLAQYSVSGFVAHEDISPTSEWQSEIERALSTMDAFLALLTPGFAASVWTQQEVGYAVARGAKIISLKMGEDPPGFISKHQALPRRQRNAEQLAKEIDRLLSADPLTSKRLTEAKASLGKDEVEGAAGKRLTYRQH